MRTMLLVTTLAAAGSLGQTPSGIAAVNNTRLYFERAGSGPAVVLLHGGNLDSRVWDDQFLPLSQLFTVVRHDIRPYGRSAASEKEFSSVEDLRALLDHLKITPGTTWQSGSGYRLPNASRTDVIPGAGHMTNMEVPGRTNQLLTAFFR